MGTSNIAASEVLCGVPKQARIHAFFAEGLDKSRLPLVVKLIPTFLHLSVFLFFAGFVCFYNLNPTVFNAVVSCVGICVFTYLCIIIMPILRYDTPYHSSLSSFAWYIWTACYSFYLPFYGSFNVWDLQALVYTYTIQKVVETLAQKLSPEIDGRALVWTLKSLGGDDKREQFFANIPAFCDSKALSAPLDALK